MNIRTLKRLTPILFLLGVYLSLYSQRDEEAWRIDLKSREAAAKGTAGQVNYDLQQLSILNRAMVYVDENYVEPSRINHRKMAGAAIEEIQKVVPELIVRVMKDKTGIPTELEVQVNDKSKRFSLSKIKNSFHLRFIFKDIFRFIQANLKHFDKLQKIEYAAINGFLSTLDPHSVLLTPTEYAEMKLNTKGRFGGLGIVIGIREGQLTIINPIEDTPASRAGLQANDRIVQINLDSTINMSLSDAVDMMRGEPDTTVDIFVMRDGWKSPKKYTLTRANIRVKSVKSHILEDGIGVIRVSNFQNTTVDEVKEAMKRIAGKRRQPKGIILDLRGNPGGLLEQATRMSDLFIDKGILVKTVGFGDKIRDPKYANSKGTLTHLPLVVLVNAASASASEIVAGALKNHQRALVLGQRTFGKGSVQLLFDNPDQSAIKLTIAQYLTPGDISIQSVGVTPAIELSPILLTEEDTFFFGSTDRQHGEASLPSHLISEKSEISKTQKPLYKLRYLQDAELLKTQRDRPNEIIVDYEITLAQRLLKQAGKNSTYKQLVQVAEQLINKEQGAQEELIDRQLEKRNIQWRSKVTRGGTKAKVTLSFDPKDAQVKAGETLSITVKVDNEGPHALHKLRAITKSKNDLFEGTEFLFGHIPVGESRSWTEKLKIYPSLSQRQDHVTLNFENDGGSTIDPVKFKIQVNELPRPHFSFRYLIDDREQGNGDGLLSPGEEVHLKLEYQNKGDGDTLELVGHLSNEGKGVEPGLFIKQGRVSPDDQTLSVGESGELSFTFKVKDGWSQEQVHTFVTLNDPKLRVNISDKLWLPIIDEKRLKKSMKQLSAPNKKALRSQPHESSHIYDERTFIKSDACLMRGTECTWYRVKLSSDRYLWAKAEDFKETKDQVIDSTQPRYTSTPKVRLNISETETHQASLEIKGTVQSDVPLQDLIIYVNNQKVYFLPGADLTPMKSAPFTATVPLEYGVNVISVYTRQSEQLLSRNNLVVHRLGESPPKENSK